MVDDSNDIPESNFKRPNDSPRNTHYYNLPILTTKQKKKLNEFKRNVNREDEIYLAKHPEVRALIALGLRNILKIRPRNNVTQIFAKYYEQSSLDLQEDVEEYLKSRTVVGHEELPVVVEFPTVSKKDSRSSSECMCSICSVKTSKISMVEDVETKFEPDEEIQMILMDILNTMLPEFEVSASQDDVLNTFTDVIDTFQNETFVSNDLSEDDFSELLQHVNLNQEIIDETDKIITETNE